MINLTPHAITLIVDGVSRTFPPSGKVARVSVDAVDAGTYDGIPVVRNTYGTVEGLPYDEQGNLTVPCIVSALVLAALPKGTPNVFAPDTGRTAIRDSEGLIIGATRLVAA